MLNASFASDTVLLIFQLFFALLIPFGIILVSITFLRRVINL